MNLCPIKLDRIDGLIGGMQSRIAKLEKHSSRADDANFVEHQHPRGPDGKFTSGGGTGSYLSSLKNGKKATRAGLAMHLLKTGLYSKKDVIAAVKELHTFLPGKEAPFHLGPKDVDFYWNAANKKSIEAGKGPIPAIPHATKGWNSDHLKNNDHKKMFNLGPPDDDEVDIDDQPEVKDIVSNPTGLGNPADPFYAGQKKDLTASEAAAKIKSLPFHGKVKAMPKAFADHLQGLTEAWGSIQIANKEKIDAKLDEIADNVFSDNAAGKDKVPILLAIKPIPETGSMAIKSFNDALKNYQNQLSPGHSSSVSTSHNPTTPSQKKVYEHLKHTPHFEFEHVNRFEDKTGKKFKAVMVADTSKIPGDYYARAMSALGPNGETTPELGAVMMDYGAHINNKLTDSERQASDVYTGSGYKDMNKALLGTTKADSFTQKQIDNMQSAIQKSVIPATVKMYRGLKCSLKDLSGFDDIEHSIGRAFVHKNFASATRRKGMGFVDGAKVVMHFTAQAGQTGLVVKSGQIGGEEETVFPHNSSFRIDKVEKVGEGHHVHVTMLGVKVDE